MDVRHSFPASFIPFPKDAIEQSIACRFEQQVRRQPNALAVKFKNHRVTYAELNRTANRLARTLPELDDRPTTPIALCMAQGATLIAAILAVLKAGHAYAPVDTRRPAAQLASLLDDLQPGAVLTDDRNLQVVARIPGVSCPVINADVEDAPDDDDLSVTVSPDAAAYVFYTSGSTGDPKGVVDVHRNVLHNVMRYTNTLGFCPSDRMSLIQHASFSGTVSTVFGALLNGAALFPYDLDGDGLAAIGPWVQRERLTIFHSVPSIFRQFAAGYRPCPELRLIRLEGDLATANDIDIFRETFGDDCILVNGLGATECGLVRQYPVDKRSKLEGESVPVGYPVEDMHVHVVDESGVKVPTGRIGEIVIESPYLATGYWGKPDLTAERFPTSGSGRRIYRSGDLGALGEDGCLEHLGRKDFRTKIAGVTVDTAQVQDLISGMDAVAQAVVTACVDGAGERRLTAYVVPHTDVRLTVRDIREYAQARLPRYMVPAAYVFLERLPLTRDGKVDRRSLPPPTVERRTLGTEFCEPLTGTETLLTAIWAEVLELRTQQIGALDSFFDLGGDSLRAARVATRLTEHTGSVIGVTALFEHRTIRELSRYVEGRHTPKVDLRTRVLERAAKQSAALRRTKYGRRRFTP